MRRRDQAAGGQSPVAGLSVLQAASKDGVMQLLEVHTRFLAPEASIEAFEFLPNPWR